MMLIIPERYTIPWYNMSFVVISRLSHMCFFELVAIQYIVKMRGVILAIVFALLVSAASHKRITYECGEFGEDFTWVGNVRNQGVTNTSWAFATISYIEVLYRVLTCNNMFLSVEQVIDGMQIACPNVIKFGYHSDQVPCALAYLSAFGIMTEYQYPFTNGGSRADLYDPFMTTPIVVDNIRTLKPNFAALVDELRRGPVIASICAEDELLFTYAFPVCIIDDDYECTQPNHVVVIIDVRRIDDGYLIGIQNSIGRDWGYDGVAYMSYTDNDWLNGENKRGLFSKMFVADVYEEFNDGDLIIVDDETKSTLTVVAFGIATACAVVIIGAIIGFVIIIIRIRRDGASAPANVGML